MELNYRWTLPQKLSLRLKSLGDVTVLCASSGCDGAASAASQIEGVSKVLYADDDAYGNALAEPIADLIVALSSDYEHIVAAATNSAKIYFLVLLHFSM